MFTPFAAKFFLNAKVFVAKRLRSLNNRVLYLDGVSHKASFFECNNIYLFLLETRRTLVRVLFMILFKVYFHLDLVYFCSLQQETKIQSPNYY
jgi:hypothetical protein